MQLRDNRAGKIGILFVHANNIDVGGADYCLYKMVRELLPTRFRPLVILRTRTSVVDMYERLGVEVIMLPIVRWKRESNVLGFLRDLFAFPIGIAYLVSVILKERIQIVHSNDLLEISGSIAAKITGRFAIQHIRMMVFENRLVRRIVSILIHTLNDRILCVSDAVQQWFFGHISVRTRKSAILFDWVDMDAVGHEVAGSDIRQELGLPGDTPLVSLVGRLETWKGHHVFVKSAGRVHRTIRGAHFLIIGGKVYGRGREGYEAELRKLAQEEGVSDHVHFLGERKDVGNVLRQSTVFVHCSIQPDPFPGVILEAMSSARPIVGARSGGVVEQIEDGISGLVFEPGADEDLAEKILKLLANEDLRSRLGIEAQQKVLTKFAKEKAVRELISVYEEAVNL
jgi:glycosyltransferase involved in cell wall biosynthesis